MFSFISFDSLYVMLSDVTEVETCSGFSLNICLHVPLGLCNYIFPRFLRFPKIFFFASCFFSDFYATDFLVNFLIRKVMSSSSGGFLSYAFEAHPEVLMGQFCWPDFGGGPSYLLVVNFKFQVSRWLFCFSVIIKSFSALTPKMVGGGISVVNQGWRKLSLILDCINRTVFLSFFFLSFKAYIQHTDSIFNHRQIINSQNPCPGLIAKNMLSKIQV